MREYGKNPRLTCKSQTMGLEQSKIKYKGVKEEGKGKNYQKGYLRYLCEQLRSNGAQ